MRLTVPLALSISAILSVKAQACGGTPSLAIIHSALPEPLPGGLFVAEIEIATDDVRAIYSTGLRAHVKMVIAGSPIGEVLLRLQEASSCDAPFANGRSGFLIGLITGRAGDRLIISPLLVSPEDSFRLPDGFKLHAEDSAVSPTR